MISKLPPTLYAVALLWTLQSMIQVGWSDSKASEPLPVLAVVGASSLPQGESSILPPRSIQRTKSLNGGGMDTTLNDFDSFLISKQRVAGYAGKDQNRMRAAVVPRGWRKTAKGWEHTSTWQIGSPLAEIWLRQRQRENHWLTDFFRWLRMVPPLAYAGLQVIAISAICCAPRLRATYLKAV